MNIQKIQGTSFTGTVNLTQQADAKNPLIRPLINHLKHHCGSKKVNHRIFFEVNAGDGPDIIAVSSTYKGNSKFSRLKAEFLSKINSEPIKDLIEWANGTKKWEKEINKI